MQDEIAAMRGTLARTSQKRNTALNRYTRYQARRATAERYEGFMDRPKDPAEAQQLPTARHFLAQVEGDLRSLTTRLNTPSQFNIQRDGEDKVRMVNEEANGLVREQLRWARRVEELGGPVVPEKLVLAAAGSSSRRGGKGQPLFFGVARELPEALQQQQQQQQEEEDKQRRRRVTTKRGRDEESEEEDTDQDAEEEDYGDDDEDGQWSSAAADERTTTNNLTDWIMTELKKSEATEMTAAAAAEEAADTSTGGTLLFADFDEEEHGDDETCATMANAYEQQQQLLLRSRSAVSFMAPATGSSSSSFDRLRDAVGPFLRPATRRLLSKEVAANTNSNSSSNNNQQHQQEESPEYCLRMTEAKYAAAAAGANGHKNKDEEKTIRSALQTVGAVFKESVPTQQEVEAALEKQRRMETLALLQARKRQQQEQ